MEKTVKNYLMDPSFQINSEIYYEYQIHQVIKKIA